MRSSEAFSGGWRFAQPGRRRASTAAVLVAICAADAFASPAMASTGLNWSGREKLDSGESLLDDDWLDRDDGPTVVGFSMRHWS